MPPQLSGRRYRLHHHSTKLQSASASSDDLTARLPAVLQLRVLRFFFEKLQDEGPADAKKTIQYLPPLSLVSKGWEQVVRSYYPSWLSFDMREQVQLKNGEIDMLDEEQMEENIRVAAQARCACPIHTGKGSLKLLIDGPELNKRNKRWQKLLDLILLKFSDFKHLNLDLFDDAQKFVEVCRSFKSKSRVLLLTNSTAQDGNHESTFVIVFC